MELVAYRDRIAALESAMLDMPQAELETRHHFAHGTYTRELIIPAGVTATGKIHRYSGVNILAKGKVRILTDDGTRDIEAPYTFVAPPGLKKAIHVLEDAVWINVHPWDGEQTLEQIEQAVISPAYDQLAHDSQEPLCLGLQQQ